MDGQWNYRDYFGHGGSSSGGSSQRPSAGGADNIDVFSQEMSEVPPTRSLSGGRLGFEELDLNSQRDGFPYLGDYTGLLQEGHGRGTQVPRPPPSGEWQPPLPRRVRQSRGGSSRDRSSQRRGWAGYRGAGSGAQQTNEAWTPNRMRGHGPPGMNYCTGPDEMGRDEIDDPEDNANDLPHYDKANWTDPNIDTFCRIFVEEMRQGNCPGGTMSHRGWQNVAKKYFERTGLNHNIRQLRNRRDHCKTLWLFYKQCLKETGLGRDPHSGAIIASEKWWRDNTERKPECKKFKHGIPTYLDCLQEMFQGVAVDGSTSCIPEDVDENENRNVGQQDEEDYPEEQPNTPSSNSSRKRGSTTDSASSPGKKKSKSPMVQAIKGLAAAFQASQEKQIELTMKQEEVRKMELQQREEMRRKEMELRKMELEQMEEMRRKEMELRKAEETREIDACLTMAIACGATEDSDEYFMATQLFENPYNRTIFLRFQTNEGRLGWLRRNLKLVM